MSSSIIIDFKKQRLGVLQLSNCSSKKLKLMKSHLSIVNGRAERIYPPVFEKPFSEVRHEVEQSNRDNELKRKSFNARLSFRATNYNLIQVPEPLERFGVVSSGNQSVTVSILPSN